MKRFVRLLTWVILIPGLALLFKLLVHEDPGYVLITGHTIFDRPFAYQTTITGLIFYAGLGFLVTYLILRLWVHLVNIPFYVVRFWKKRRERRADKSFARGQLALMQHKAEVAEDLFLSAARFSTAPSLCYIGAARAAVIQNSPNRRDHYLSLIDTVEDQTNHLLAGIYRGEILFEAHEYVKAEKVLDSLRLDAANHPRILELLAQIYQITARIKELQDILPILYRVLPKNDREEVTVPLYRALLRLVSQERDLSSLREVWSDIPKELRQNNFVLIEYATYLMDLDEPDEAELILRQALKRQWSEQLITAYGYIYRGNFKAVMKHALAFLAQHPTSHYACLAVARLSLRNQTPEAALNYVQQGLAIKTTPDALVLLAEIYDALGNSSSALTTYRQASLLLNQRDGFAKVSGELVTALPHHSSFLDHVNEVSDIELTKNAENNVENDEKETLVIAPSEENPSTIKHV